MQQTPSIRYLQVQSPQQIAQAAALADVIWHECFAKILQPAQIDYMVHNIQSADAMARQIEQEGYRYYLLYFDGAPDEKPGGYIAVREGDGKLMLSKLYFLAEYRGRGYARESIKFVEQLGRDAGCSGVWLTVNRHNERAIAVYRKTGFDVVREEVSDIGGGFVMDDFVFEKPL